MRTLSPDTATTDLVNVGLYHLEALGFFDQTLPLAANFGAINARLEHAVTHRLAAEREAAPRQARVLLSDLDLDALVTAFADAVRAEDEAEHGVLFARLFPDEVAPMLAPVGESEARQLRAMLATLAATPEATALRGNWGALLERQLGAYERVVHAARGAAETLRAAREEEQAARAAWFGAIDAHRELLAAAFPDVEATFRLFFPADPAAAERPSVP